MRCAQRSHLDGFEVFAVDSDDDLVRVDDLDAAVDPNFPAVTLLGVALQPANDIAGHQGTVRQIELRIEHI